MTISAFDEETQDALQQRLFGKGLQLQHPEPDSQALDLVYANGDFAMTSGASNLAQDLAVALLTATGSDTFNVAYGFDGLRVLSGDFPPAIATELVKLAITKTCAMDTRIKKVLSVEMTETEAGSRVWNVAVDVQTVLGDVQRFDVGTAALQ
jgi:hypothetical protein